MSRRDDILQAAIDIMSQEETTSFSIDSVVERAGASKGAFFHHFQTKSDLFEAVLLQVVEDYRGQMHDAVPRFGSLSRAMVETTIDMLSRRSAFAAVLVKCVTEDIRLRAVVGQAMSDLTQEMAAEGTAPWRAHQLRLALDGMVFLFGLGMISPDTPQFHRLAESVRLLANPTCEERCAAQVARHLNAEREDSAS
jgi:AcrR family transcriptional regulator